MEALHPPNAAADGGTHDARTGARAGCYCSSLAPQYSNRRPQPLLLVRYGVMHTHLFTSIPNRLENIPEDVSSADGDGARSLIDGDVLEAAEVNTNPVLQLAQRDRKTMAAASSQKWDAPASGEFYLVRSVTSQLHLL